MNSTDRSEVDLEDQLNAICVEIEDLKRAMERGDQDEAARISLVNALVAALGRHSELVELHNWNVWFGGATAEFAFEIMLAHRTLLSSEPERYYDQPEACRRLRELGFEVSYADPDPNLQTSPTETTTASSIFASYLEAVLRDDSMMAGKFTQELQDMGWIVNQIKR